MMAAVLGLEDEVVVDICRQVRSDGLGIVEAANFNAPGQIVISGEKAAVEAAIERLRDAGAKKAMPLLVSGAFHSPLMEHVREELAAALEDLEINRPRCPVYLNVTAQPATDPGEIRAFMLEQLTSPVRWSDIVKQMHADQADAYVEVGAGNVLANLVRRTLGKSANAETVGTADALEALIYNNNSNGK